MSASLGIPSGPVALFLLSFFIALSSSGSVNGSALMCLVDILSSPISFSISLLLSS